MRNTKEDHAVDHKYYFGLLSLVAKPGIMADLPVSPFTHSGTASSIFAGSGAFGYVFVGLLAFVLGVSVTVLSYHFHQRNKREEEKEESSDG